MNETNNSFLTATGTSTINRYSGTSTLINGGNGTILAGTVVSSDYHHNYPLTISNSYTMKTKQVKAAIFTIERNDKNEVTSSKFVKELWVEIKNGASLDLAVAKELKGDFDPETTVIREIHSFSF